MTRAGCAGGNKLGEEPAYAGDGQDIVSVSDHNRPAVGAKAVVTQLGRVGRHIGPPRSGWRLRSWPGCCNVAGYGVEGDDQFYGYLQVGLASGDETQHVYFALCQAKAISLLDESLVIAIELGLRPLTGVPAWSTGNF